MATRHEHIIQSDIAVRLTRLEGFLDDTNDSGFKRYRIVFCYKNKKKCFKLGSLI